ncbi:MAG: T9SS type A sorting domain-containing protein [bacterium]
MKNTILFGCLFLFVLFTPNEKANCRWEQVSSFYTATHSFLSVSAIDSNNYLLQAKRLYFIDIEDSDQDMREGLMFYLTSNYGLTWDSTFSTMKLIKASFKVNNFEGMQFFTKDTIYLMISLQNKNAMLAKTFDGGKTWDSLYCPLARKSDSPAPDEAFFYFKNSKEGYYALGSDSMVVTKDGGLNWSKLELPQLRDTLGTGYWMSSYSVYKNTFLISAVRGYDDFLWKKILISKDMGQTWEIIDDQADKIAQGTINFFIRNESEIWGLGSNPDNSHETVIRKSLDGGKTWERIDGGKILDGLGEKLHFFGKDSIILQTRWTLFKSIDNGNTWVEYYDNPSHYHLESVSITKWYRGLVIDRNNVYRCDPRPNAVEFAPDNSKLSVFPNPIAPNQTMNITYYDNTLLGNVIFKIVDFSGKVIDEYIPENISSYINVQYSPETPFARGAYFLVIESCGVVVAKERFVVK